MSDQPASTPTPPPAPFSPEYFASEIAVAEAFYNQLKAQVTATDVYQALIRQEAVLTHLRQQQALLAAPPDAKG